MYQNNRNKEVIYDGDGHPYWPTHTKPRKTCTHPRLVPHSEMLSINGQLRYGICFRCGKQVVRSAASVTPLPGSFGEILGGKPTWGRSCPKRVSVTNTPNELMRRCFLRWQTETSGGAFHYFWQHFLGVSLKDRFPGHLTPHCEARRNFLTPKISRLLPGSVMEKVIL